MTRSELVDVVYQRHGGISRREAQAHLDLILNLIKDRLAAGERVEIPGFGSFEIVKAAGRVGRHPVTGRKFKVPGRRSLAFRPSRLLQQSLNQFLRGICVIFHMSARIGEGQGAVVRSIVLGHFEYSGHARRKRAQAGRESKSQGRHDQ